MAKKVSGRYGVSLKEEPGRGAANVIILRRCMEALCPGSADFSAIFTNFAF